MISKMFPIITYGLGSIGSLGAVTLNSSQLTVAQMIVNAANAVGIDPSIPLGIAAHESNFNPNATNVNTNGTTDYGVMQLNTTTVNTLGVSDPYDPLQNITAGVGLIASYLNKYGGDVSTALTAYAAGPGAVASGNVPSSVGGFVSSVTNYDASPILNSVGSSSPIPIVNPSVVSLMNSDSGDSSDPISQLASNLGIDPTTFYVGLGISALTVLVMVGKV